MERLAPNRSLDDEFEGTHKVLCTGDYTWTMGAIPVGLDDWDVLAHLKITTVINFSHAPLKPRWGFEIVNIHPNIASLVMPMTSQEKELVRDFLFVADLAKAAGRLYICGDSNHRAAMALAIAKRTGVRIKAQTREFKVLTTYERSLARAFDRANEIASK